MRPVAFVGYDDAAELGLVVVAMFAILILAGLWLVSVFFAGLFRKIPLVGGPIADAFDWAARALRAATMSTWHGTLWAVGKMAHSFTAFARDTVDIIHNALEALTGAVEHQVDVILPREISQLRKFTITIVARALNTALQYADAVRKQAYQWYQDGRAYTDARYQQAIKFTTDLVRATATELLTLINQARAEAKQEFQAAEQYAKQLFNQAEADASAGDASTLLKAVATALTDVDTEARDAAAPVWAGIQSQLVNLQHVVGSDFAEFLKLLQEIPTDAPADLAAVVAVGMAIIPPTLKITADCTIPTCRDLGPLRSLLHLLEDAGFLALLLAWLAYCVQDPEAAARDTADVVDPIASATIGPILSLLGAP